MLKVDSMISDDGSNQVAEQILERWTCDRGSVRFFRSSANFIYHVRDYGDVHFLRFADTSERSHEAIKAEMAVLAAVARAGITVVTPMASQYGKTIETVDTAWGTFHAVVFAALEGQQCELNEFSESGFRTWGETLGKLHAATSALTTIAARLSWSDHVAFINNYLPAGSPVLRAEYSEIVAAISALPITQETYGLIHGDFELDNLVWREAAASVLDFDDCSRL